MPFREAQYRCASRDDAPPQRPTMRPQVQPRRALRSPASACPAPSQRSRLWRILPPRSGRLIARANAGLALAKAGKLPHAGTGGIDVGADIDVDKIGLVGRDRFADRLAKVARAIDADALDAAGARHRREIRIVALAG